MWRPKNWKNINPEYGEVTTNDYLYAISVSFEAGADAMHKADLEWLNEHNIISVESAGAITYSFHATSKDWQEFSENDEENSD